MLAGEGPAVLLGVAAVPQLVVELVVLAPLVNPVGFLVGLDVAVGGCELGVPCFF